MAQDVKFKKSNENYIDLYEENGDFASTNGLDTAVVICLFTDKRTDSGNIEESFRRGGFSGNILDKDTGFELGSELWVLKQSRADSNLLNKCSDYAYNCLTWMNNQGITDRIETPTEYSYDSNNRVTGIKINVILYKENNTVAKYYAIYSLTTNFITGI